MKFKSWMGRRKTKKPSSELSVSVPTRSHLDSAGNSPTSPQLPSSTDDDPSPTRLFHPAIAYLSPFRISARGTCACACFSAGLPTAFPCTCYPSLETPKAAFVQSPRQRSKIRTNPWLTPGVSTFRTSSSSSCSDVVSPSSQSSQSSQDIQGGSQESSVGSSEDPPSSSDDVSLVSPEADESSENSSSDECETLNELGQFEENYEYERETDILDDEQQTVRKDPLAGLRWEDREDVNSTPTAIDEPIQYVDDDETTPLVQSEEGADVTTPDTPTSPRTLGEIRESLEEKVRRLRLERLIVEEKIREAREEETLRREERIKFQKQLILHRRHILLRTLQHLREKLEDQSTRLQDAYSATLQMQLQVRRQLMSRQQDKNHEAPF